MNKKNKPNKLLEKKDHIIHSLREVNCFLYNINKVLCINKIYKKFK